jgi:hypothetical protein
VSGRGCPVGENTILAWKNGAQTTYCLTPQQVLLYALPDCKDGEIVVFHEDDDQGRVPVGSDDIKIAKFVCEPKPKLKCTTARRNTQQQSVPLIVDGDSGAVSNVNQNARAWGMQCQNGYVRTGCYIATGTKGVQDSDLYSSNGLDCLSDNEEAAYADITIVCCTMK